MSKQEEFFDSDDYSQDLSDSESTVEQLVAELKKGPQSELYRLLLKMMDNSNKANTKASVLAALAEADLLTINDLLPDVGNEGVRKQLENAAFAAVKEAARLGIIAPGPKATEPF